LYVGLDLDLELELGVLTRDEEYVHVADNGECVDILIVELQASGQVL
jgi:hypothetical protein